MDFKKFFTSILIAFLVLVPVASAVVIVEGSSTFRTDKISMGAGITCTESGLLVTCVSEAIDILSAVFEGATANAFETTLAVVDPTADNTATFPDATGTVKLKSAASALTAGAAVTLTVVPGTDKLYTDTIVTDNQDQTITFSGAGLEGDRVTIKFITDAAGSGDEVITFHSTLVNSTGTLTLANLASDVYVVSFISDGTKWNETGRTAVQTT